MYSRNAKKASGANAYWTKELGNVFFGLNKELRLILNTIKSTNGV